MISSRNGKLLYVSMGQGVHDSRFIECAKESGWEVTGLRCDGLDNVSLNGVDSKNWIGNRKSISSANHEEFRSEFREIVKLVQPNLIQIGPLSPVAAVLDEDLGVQVLAVSWARDLLHDIHNSEWSKEVAISAIRMSSHLLVDCVTVRDVAVSLGAPIESVSILPWGVDLKRFSFFPRNKQIGLPTIVSLRTLEPIYSVSTLIDAAREINSLRSSQQVEIVIAGTGSQEKELKNLAFRYGLGHSTNFVGQIPESDLPIKLLNCDIYVSTSPIDGSSISMLQSMALGLLCIVPDISSNCEWIEHGTNGFLYEPQNSQALSELIIEVAAKPKLLGSLVVNARKTVEKRANWDKGRQILAELYYQVAYSSG